MNQSPQPLRRRRSTAKLLARLNPKGIGLPDGGGRGTGGSDESAIDIAAALGYIGSRGEGYRLAANVLCLRWWPGLYEGPARVVARQEVTRTQTITRITGEREKVFTDHPVYAGVAWRRLKRERQEVAYRELVPVERAGETEAFRVLAGILERRLRERVLERREAVSEFNARRAALGKVSPLLVLDEATLAKVTAPGFIAGWARAVIEEYRRPNQCPTCLGYGERMQISHGEDGRPKAEVTGCEQCGGQGVTAWSVKRRGKATRIGEHTFRDHLAVHHDGALAFLRELEYRGATYLLRRLGLPDR